jgi:S-adenosylmethionine hydrolase
VGALIALIGSNDHLELAVRNGSAAQTLGVGIGDSVRVLKPDEG